MKEVRATTSQGLPLLLQQGSYASFPESFRHYLMKSWVAAHRRFTDKGADRLRSRFTGILANPNTTVVMALFPDDQAKRGEERIIGWAVSDRGAVLHYIYVRNVYRHGGAGHVLLAAAVPEFQTPGPVVCTHWAKALPKDGWAIIPSVGGFRYVGSDIIRT